jgi:hypothetical protein
MFESMSRSEGLPRGFAEWCFPCFVVHPFVMKPRFPNLRCCVQRTRFLAYAEHFPHLSGFFLVYDEFPALWHNVIVEHRVPANPFAFAPGSGEFIARPLTDNLPLKLSKR